MQLLAFAYCGCLAAAPVWAQPTERYEDLSDDLSQTLNIIRQEISGEVAKQHATEIWERDRWDSWDKHHETAQYVAQQFRAIGLEQVEVIPYKSDGRTKYGDWTSQQAWDVDHARLTVVEPATLAGKVIADYRDVPQTLTTRCGPTPPGGIQAEVVAVRDDGKLEDITADDLRGKLVLIETAGGRAPAIAEADIQVDLVERTSGLIRAAAAGSQTGKSLGRVAFDGTELIAYRLDRGLRTLPTVMELVPEKHRERIRAVVEAAGQRLRAQAECQTNRLNSALETMTAARGISPIIPYTRPEFPSAARAKCLIPTRKVVGTLTLVDAAVPIPKGRNWNFTWSWRANTPWWWADGKRDVYEIARRSALETGREFSEEYLEDTLAQFDFFAECGYASLRWRGENIMAPP